MKANNLLNNVKLRLSISALNKSSIFKKILSASVVYLSVAIVSITPSMADVIVNQENLSPTGADNTAPASVVVTQASIVPVDVNESIDELRKFYKSPVKDLNAIIKKTDNVEVAIPAYSIKQGKSFIKEKYSETKTETTTKEVKQSPFEWLSNNGKYSPFQNNPAYSNDGQTNAAASTNTAAYKYDNLDTSVMTLRVNEKLAYDFEGIVWPDGSISVPIKTLAELLDIQVEQNHVTGEITFIQPLTGDTITIDPANSKIIAGTNLIEVKNPKMVFVKEGFIVKDDIFVPEQVAKDLLDIKTNFSQEKYAMDLTTNRLLKALVQVNDQEQRSSDFVVEEPTNTVNEAQKENKIFKIKKISYNIGSSMNQSVSSGLNTSNSTASLGFSSTGNFLGGEYNLGASTYYTENGLQINNYRASLDYIRPKYELSIGATNANLSDMIVPGSTIWGVRFGSVGSSTGSSVPRLIQGKAEDNSYVELFVNEVYAEKQLVRNGQYQFDSLNYPGGSNVHVKVEQVSQDGSRKVVYDRKFSQDKDLLAPGQKQFMVFSGIDSSTMTNSFTLFGDTFDQGYVQPLKFVTGAKFRMGISDRLTMGVNVAKDYIIRQPSKLLLENIQQISSARTYRTGRSSSGTVVSVDMDYLATKDLRISSEIGYSMATSSVDPAFDPNGSDFGGYIGFQYTKPNYSINAKAFNYGPDFYTPGSSGLMDRRGVEVTSNWRLGKVSFSGGLTRYDSNLDNFFIGGRSSVLDYYLYASGNIDENSTVRVGVTSSGAENALYYDRDTTFDITLDRRITEKAKLTLNYAKTIRKSRMPGAESFTTQKNDRLNAELTYDAGKIGIIRLAHEMMMLDPVDRLILGGIDQSYFMEPIYSKNIRLTLDRSSLPIKGFTFSPNVGYRYGGQNKGLNCGMNLGYIFRSGRQISVNYAYNSSFGRYMPGALSFGGSHSHSLSFNFTDTIGFGIPRPNKTNNPYQTTFDANSGVIKGTVFVDLNQNGVKDQNENGLAGVDINFQNLFDITTDKDGNFIAANIPSGLRKVSLKKDTLPVIYTPSVSDALVNVKNSKVYVANLGVIVTPGSISGRINIDKNGANNDEIVVLLIDKNGKELKYTTTDSSGSYYLDSIAPGDYTIAIDKNFLAYKGLQEANEAPVTVNIPLVADDFVDIKDINITLIPNKGELQKF